MVAVEVIEDPIGTGAAALSAGLGDAIGEGRALLLDSGVPLTVVALPCGF